MDISIKEFNTYQNYAKLNGYRKITCSFCDSDIIPIEKNEVLDSVRCIYCNTILKLNYETLIGISDAISNIIKKQSN